MPDIALWNKCDNKCVMCTNMDSFVRQNAERYSLKQQIKKFENYLKGKAVYLKNSGDDSYVNLTGGEPTLHPDFFKFLAYLRKRIPKTRITLLTNGRRFADASFAEKFARTAAPPCEVAFSLLGSTPAGHDAVTGVKGSFAECVKGIKNLFAFSRGQGIEIRIVLIRQNVSDFGPMLEAVLKKFKNAANYRVVAIHYEIEGMSFKNMDKISLKLSESAAEIKRNLKLVEKFPDFRLYHFPLCVLDGRLRKYAWITLPREDRVYPAECRRCREKKRCLGLMKEYCEYFGARELRAIK